MRPGGQAGQFARNSGFGAVSGIATALGAFLSSIVIAHLLDVAQTGAVSFAQWLVMLVAGFADLGIAATICRFMPELAGRGLHARSEELAALLVRVPLLTGTACFIAFACYAGWLFVGEGEPRETAVRWLLIGTACALQTMSASAIGYFRGRQRFDRAALLTVASACLQIGGVGIGSLAFQVNGAIAGYCAGAVVPAAFALTLLRWSARVPAGYGRRLLRYALYACASGLLAGFVWSRLELLFLQQFRGDEAVGLFAIALSIANVAAQGPMLLTAGLLPYFAENVGSNNFAAVEGAYVAGTRALAALVLPLCCGMAAIMPVALPLLYGTGFAAAVVPATVIVIGSGLGSIGFVGVHLLHGVERTDFLFLNSGMGAALAVAAGLILVPQFGVIGAASGRLIIQATLVAVGFWFITRRLRCAPPWRDLAKLVLCAGICAVSARLCLDAMPGFVGLPTAIAAGGFAYITSVRLLRALPPDDILLMREFIGRLPATLRAAGEILLNLIASPAPAPSQVAAAAPRRRGNR